MTGIVTASTICGINTSVVVSSEELIPAASYPSAAITSVPAASAFFACLIDAQTVITFAPS